MNNEPIKILFSAISGYGFYYLKTFFEEVAPEKAVICGIIDPQPEKSGYYARIQEAGIPVYSDIDSFFKDGRSADLTVVSSPLQFHVPQAITALENGSNVLVDKPAAVTVQELERLIALRDQTGLFVEVGYQWSFSEPVMKLKQDILDGRFGRPLKMKTICLWPRPFAYFNRNNWAGRIRDDSGELVLDSIANNACAHFLHNMFFLCGTEMNRSARPVSVSGRLRRAYLIENFDTVECRAVTDTGVDIGFFASHATEIQLNPTFELVFENARVRLGEDTNGIVAFLNDGSHIEYGHPDSDQQFKKLHWSINRCLYPGPAVCPPEAALPQTMCINALHEISGSIETIPVAEIVTAPDRIWVPGLGESLQSSYLTF